MRNHRSIRALTAGVLVVVLVAGIALVWRPLSRVDRIYATGYFENSNGIFVGDEIRVLGVPVGRISKIEPQPQRAKISFWIDGKYDVPADAEAVIISPQLITARAIQLTPAYTSGPTLADGAVIPENRTAVPVEWDDLRQQLQKLTESLQPSQPDGTSPLGALINTTADNLRGQGPTIRESLIQLSQTLSTLGDHSDDIFGTIKNLSTLVSALGSSSDLMRQLNGNLAAVTAMLANDPNEVGDAVTTVNTAITDVQGFLAHNREAVGTLSDKVASISTAVLDSLDDLKQTLHVAPNAFANFVNIYEPAHGSLTGAFALNHFSNPITFLCGAIQAASRLGAEKASKLCVQYLAPIIKNRQYNQLPIGLNPIVNAAARPNEVTYSEDRLRPDYQPPGSSNGPPPPDGSAQQPPPAALPGAPLAAEAPPAAAATPEPVPTDPAAGLPGLMTPPGSGS
jgi:phospholipid/cholesterol/gamma-HCH transport system substrate-binding protein